MALGIDAPQRFDAHLGVNRRGLKAGVTEQFLNVANIGPAFEQVRRAGVTQEVSATFCNVGRTKIPRDQAAQRVGMKRRSVALSLIHI